MFNTSTCTSNNCAVVACLFNSCHLPLVVAMDKAPFNFNPAEKPIFFSSSLYNSVVYFLILVTAAEGPN